MSNRDFDFLIRQHDITYRIDSLTDTHVSLEKLHKNGKPSGKFIVREKTILNIFLEKAGLPKFPPID